MSLPTVRNRLYQIIQEYKLPYMPIVGNDLDKEKIQKIDLFKDIKSIDLVNHFYPRFYLSEDYRTVRTSILLSHAGSPPKSITFSSALPKEGKTVSAANMGVAFSHPLLILLIFLQPFLSILYCFIC